MRTQKFDYEKRTNEYKNWKKKRIKLFKKKAIEKDQQKNLKSNSLISILVQNENKEMCCLIKIDKQTR